MQKIIERIKALILKPVDELTAIKNEPMTIAGIYKDYLLILVALPSIASFIGYTIFGFGFRFISYALIYSILIYALSLIGIYINGLIVDALAPSFGSKKDLIESFKTIAFSILPLYIAGILFIIPALTPLAFIAGGAYSLFLLYLSLKIIKETSNEKLIPYFVILCIISLIVNSLIFYLAREITFRSVIHSLGYYTF